MNLVGERKSAYGICECENCLVDDVGMPVCESEFTPFYWEQS
jgi:hypothetical protein